MLRRLGLWALILVVMAFLAWCVYPMFLPMAKKVSLQHGKLLTQAANRKWDAVYCMMSSSYQDGFGLKRDDALQTAKEMFAPFLTLSFEWTKEEVEINGSTATVTGVLRLHGTGPVGTSEILKRVNDLQKPWTFEWKKHPVTSDWKLTCVTNPELGGVVAPP
jgi:hypothetical protein